MVDFDQALNDPPEPYLAVRLDGRSNHQTVRSLDG